MARSENFGKDREVDPNSFKCRFGRLVRRYRELLGKTQMDAAFMVFGDETKASRISDVERGRNEPQPETVSLFREALGIPQHEIDALRASLIPESVVEELGLRRELLEALAQRFEHQNPDAPDRELINYLKNKANDYKVLKDKIAYLARIQRDLAKKLSLAQKSIDKGDFEKADRILVSAERVRREDSLERARDDADLRAMRATTALLKGDADSAFKHFEAAIAFISPHDLFLAAKRRHGAFKILFKHGQHYPGKSLDYAISILEQNLFVYSQKAYPIQWANTQHSLAIALRTLGERVAGEDALEMLDRSVEACHLALLIRKREDLPEKWAATKDNLGKSLEAIGRRVGGAAGRSKLAEAIEAFEAALEVHTREDLPELWSMTHISMAAVYLALGEYRFDSIGSMALEKAISGYEMALEVCSKEETSDVWAVAHCNLASALTILGARDNGLRGARALVRALRALASALEVTSQEEKPVRWAQIERNSGNALLLLADRHSGALKVKLLKNAQECFKSSLEINSESDMPADWAKSKSGLGLCLINLGIHNGDRKIIKEGISELDKTLETFQLLLPEFGIDAFLHYRERGILYLEDTKKNRLS